MGCSIVVVVAQISDEKAPDLSSNTIYSTMCNHGKRSGKVLCFPSSHHDHGYVEEKNSRERERRGNSNSSGSVFLYCIHMVHCCLIHSCCDGFAACSYSKDVGMWHREWAWTTLAFLLILCQERGTNPKSVPSAIVLLNCFNCIFAKLQLSLSCMIRWQISSGDKRNGW